MQSLIDGKQRNRVNASVIANISIKSSIFSLGNALCIDSMMEKKNTKLDVLRVERVSKGGIGHRMKLKKEIEPHKVKSSHSMVEAVKSSLIDATHRRQISPIRSRKGTQKLQKATHPQIFQQMQTAAFCTKPGEKPVQYELKMEVKKVQSLQRSVENVEESAKSYYRRRNFKRSSAKLSSNNIQQSLTVEEKSDWGKKTTTLVTNNRLDDSLMGKQAYSSNADPVEKFENMGTFFQPYKNRYAETKRFIRSTLISYEKKKLKKLNERKEPSIAWHYHIKNIISNPQKVSEEQVDIVEAGAEGDEIIEENEIMDRNWQNQILEGKSATSIEVGRFDCEKRSYQQIVGKCANSRVEIASITKIMTCFLAINIARLFRINIHSEKTIVREKAVKMTGTSAKLAYSDTLTVYELLHGLMLPSGNDAAVAVAEWGGKTIRKYCELAQKYLAPPAKTELKGLNFFVEYRGEKKSYQKLFIAHMNKAASALKLKNTHFANSHGLMNEKSYSNAHDVMRLTYLAMRNSVFREIVGKKTFSCKVHNRTYCKSQKMEWSNTNKLLGIEGFIGAKTGVTPAAGPCLSSVYQLNSHEYIIIVVLKAKSMESRFKESLQILKAVLQRIDSKKYNQLARALQIQEKKPRVLENEQAEYEDNILQNQKEVSSDSDDDDDCIEAYQ